MISKHVEHIEDTIQQTLKVDTGLVKCWATVTYSGPILKQHWINILCLLASTKDTGQLI